MSTPTIIANAYTALRGQFTAAQVTFRIAGRSIVGLIDTQTAQELMTAQGMDPGYEATVYFLKSELPTTPALASGDVIIQMVGTQPVNKRVRRLQEIGTTVLAVSLGAEFAS